MFKLPLAARLGAGLLAGLLGLGAAQAQTAGAAPWPTRPVRFTVPFPAGSAPDVLLRYLGVKLSDKWGQAVIIDNKPGGSGVIGMTAVMNAPADGHNFGFSQGSALAIVPQTLKAANYDFERDFVPVGLVATSPLMIAVPYDSPFKSVDDVLKTARLKSESVEVGDVGRATLPHLAAAMLGLNGNAQFLHVHFQGGPPAIQAILGGQVKLMLETLGPLLPQVQGNRMRVLASMSDRVEPGLEAYPLAIKTVPGAVAQGWFAVFARKGTDAAAVARMNADLNEALARPDVVAKFKEFAAYPRPGSPADLARLIAAEHKNWATVIAKIGLQPE